MIPIKLTDAALARAMVQEEKDRQQEVLTGRMLHEGSVGATLTDRLKQYVVPPELTLNICKPVVTAVVDRLKVNDWEAVPMIDATGKSNADPADETAKEAHALAGDWAWSMWTRLGLNVASNNAHLWTVRGQIELQLGEPEQARKASERALALRPDYPPARELAAQLGPANAAAASKPVTTGETRHAGIPRAPAP